MNPENFINPSAGAVKLHPTGYHTFIPATLPPEIGFDRNLVLKLSQADTALSELAGIGRLLPNPHILIGPLVQREAVLSSQIEGTQASLSELLLDDAQAQASPPDKSADLQEIRNYVAALEFGLERLRSLPLSLRLVREIHAKLMNGVRGQMATPGEFRRSQNWIGPAGSNPMTAPHVPPPPEEMERLLGDWETYLHVRGAMPDLVQCAILHEQFEAIHPFLDGNGRIGRLLITLFLVERGRMPRPLLYLSDFIERHRQDYYDLLQRVRTHGDWNAWLHYFLSGVEETARDAATRAQQLIAIREQLLQETNGTHRLVDRLLGNPYIRIPVVAAIEEISIPTATKLVRELERKGLLRETTGRNWGKTYVAERVLEAISRRSQDLATQGTYRSHT
ncbi:MAG: Fic family protein [Opitutaceae bacterium]|nr:Fic family protein [Opitutaceae bacterium]